MKKLTLCITIMLIFSLVLPVVTNFETASASEINLSSENCVLMEFETGKVLFEKNADKRGQIASMTKIMLLNLIFDKLESGEISKEDMVNVSERAMSMGGSQVFLDVKNKYAVNDLVKSIIVASANDSSVAMAEYLFGSVESAVTAMNDMAEMLGMQNTNFVNVTGLPHDDAYSTARDVAIMTRQLVGREMYKNYSKIWMDKIPHGEDNYTEISNTNKLLKRYAGCDGGKTGFTNQAMHCISATAQKNDMRLIATVMHGSSSNERFQDAITMFDYGFGGFERKEVVSDKTPLEITAKVINGKAESVGIVPSESFSMISKKGGTAEYILNTIIKEDIKAPVKAGDEIGILEVVCDGEVVKTISLIASEDVKRAGIKDHLKNLFPNKGDF
ncbi:MAG: D-alanyl-D-alanine carboxypeptidase family protein [Bacillota bacterium]